MTKREIFEKSDDLSEDELNAKNSREVYAKNDVMTTVIKRCRDEKKKRRKKNRFIQKKINEPSFLDCRMSRIQSQIKNRKHICERKNTRKIFC